MNTPKGESYEVHISKVLHLGLVPIKELKITVGGDVYNCLLLEGYIRFGDSLIKTKLDGDQMKK